MLAEKLQNVWSQAVAGDALSIIALISFAIVYLVVTFALESHLWRRCDPASKKLGWSFIILIPILGWLFYLAFYKVPPSQHFR